MHTRPQVIAHRGASGYAPEITLEAYRLALQMGVDGIEMDVHRLRDGEIVAIHDPDLERTTNGKGPVSELTLTELKTLDAGSWFNRKFPEKARPEYAGLRVPTLQEIIDLTRGTSVALYIEIKNPERYSSGIESPLLSLIRSNQLEKRARFLSFSPQSLARIKILDPSMHTALLIARAGENPVDAALQVSANELGILHSIATPAIVDASHKNGLWLSVWTADEEADLQRAIQLGVDRIITNYPDRLNRLLRPDAIS